MSPRPSYVSDIDATSPVTLFWHGAGFRSEELPVGSQIAYAAEPVAPLSQPSAHVRDAIDNPRGSEPLASRLRPGISLTIAFDDIVASAPQVNGIDARQRVIETVLELAAEVGVDDVVLIAARGMNRRATDGELRTMLGDRVYDSFMPSGTLLQHDAEDTDNLVALPENKGGTLLEFNKRAIESDLLVYVSVDDIDHDIYTGLAFGLASYRSAASRRPAEFILNAADLAATRRETQRKVVAELGKKVDIFGIACALNNDIFPSRLSFLHKKEAEWSFKDKAAFIAANTVTNATPGRLAQSGLTVGLAAKRLSHVVAGDLAAIDDVARGAITAQSSVDLDNQADIVTVGLPFGSPESVNSIFNPILVASQALGRMYHANTGTPVVREGGVMIISNPTPWQFHPVHHASYIEMSEEVLTDTTDGPAIQDAYEKKYAEDEWYRHLYRTSNSFHGAHPLHLWYDIDRAVNHLGRVIIVGGETEAVRQLGFKPASTLQDALEMAEDVVGEESSLTHLHTPPEMIVNVRS